MSPTKDVCAAVEAELRFDSLLDESYISVNNISGIIALSGTVPTYPQYREAAAAARRVSGVTEVHNHLQVVLDVGHYRDDALLTTAANDALETDIMVPDEVEAIAQDGDITLSGTVSTGVQRTAAADAVSGLAGVRTVKNYIDIGRLPDVYDVSVHVQDALDRYALVPDDSDVSVVAKSGTVTLSGHVRTWAEHDAVVGAAWMGVGVSDLWDDLSVTGLP
jgi:osmotically-inducible protein OsmY